MGNSVKETIFDARTGKFTVVEREQTAEEIEAIRRLDTLAKLSEASRPLTEAEVSRMLITAQINTITVDDNTALRMKEFYPAWEPGIVYTAAAGRPVGYKVQKDGKLWKLRQEHTSQIGWEPENAASLWEQINETHAGTLDDPIPYEGNMALESGKHYVQGGVIYRCIRDTGNPVYNALADLVGLYVETV